MGIDISFLAVGFALSYLAPVIMKHSTPLKLAIFFALLAIALAAVTSSINPPGYPDSWSAAEPIRAVLQDIAVAAAAAATIGAVLVNYQEDRQSQLQSRNQRFLYVWRAKRFCREQRRSIGEIILHEKANSHGACPTVDQCLGDFVESMWELGDVLEQLRRFDQESEILAQTILEMDELLQTLSRFQSGVKLSPQNPTYGIMIHNLAIGIFHNFDVNISAITELTDEILEGLNSYENELF